MKKEYELIMLAVLVDKTEKEKNRIKELLTKEIDWVEIAGILMNHRLGGYFYFGLDEEQRYVIPKELRKNLNMLVKGQTYEQKFLYKYIRELYDTLENQDLRYAGLKGIIYGATIYSIGMRRSNDLDLLVYEDDLDKLDKLMKQIGYIQGSKKDGKIVEATKKEKLIQRMNYHDLVPYMKEAEDRIIEIDINFLVDGKDNLIDDKVFDMGTSLYEGDYYTFRGLNLITNFAFLICHFYREATGEIWVNNKRNLLLYKIVDIVNYLRHFEDQLDSESVVKTFEKLNILEKALYTFLTIKKFYENEKLINECIKKMSTEYIDLYQKYFEDSVFERYYEDSYNMGR